MDTKSTTAEIVWTQADLKAAENPIEKEFDARLYKSVKKFDAKLEKLEKKFDVKLNTKFPEQSIIISQSFAPIQESIDKISAFSFCFEAHIAELYKRKEIRL